jgi:hypothetical protein
MRWLAPDRSNETSFNLTSKIKKEISRSIFESPAINDWWDLEKDEPFIGMEITGPEGCGKSSLAAAVADEVNTLYCNDKVRVVFVSLSVWDTNILSLIIFDILNEKRDLLSSEILNLHETKTEQASPQACFKIYHTLARSLERLYVITDGGSRYSTRDCIKAVSTIPTNVGLKVRLLYTGMQFVPSWEGEQDALFPFLKYSISIDVEALNTDIEDYAQASGKEVAALHCNEQNRESFANEISKALLQEQSRDFKIMKAKHEYLLVQPTKEDVRSALQILPPELENLYLETLKTLQARRGGQFRVALEIFKAALGSFRALELEEVETILTLDLDARAVNKDRAPSFDQLKSTILQLCRMFVTIDGNHVKPASSSTRRFLEQLYFHDGTGEICLSSTCGVRHKSLQDLSREMMLKKCLVYLSLPALSGDSPLPALGDEAAWKGRFPFFEYASNSWPNHLMSLVNTLKNPEKNWRMEFGFSPDILGLLAVFLNSRNCWTFLEGSVLFSSVLETTHAFEAFAYPIKETGSYLQQWGIFEGLENVNAHVLENWVSGAKQTLISLEKMSSHIADEANRKSFVLEVIRQFRQTGPRSLIEVQTSSVLQRSQALMETMFSDALQFDQQPVAKDQSQALQRGQAEISTKRKRNGLSFHPRKTYSSSGRMDGGIKSQSAENPDRSPRKNMGSH